MKIHGLPPASQKLEDDTFMDEGTAALNSLSISSSTAQPNLICRPGLMLANSYKLLSHIGAGGMGSVWLAEHTRTLGKLAIKLIHVKQLGNPNSVHFFELEAQHTASLHHPNIVRVFDYGHDQGLLYLAMEYVPGRSLASELIAGGGMEWQRVLRIAEQVLAALMSAHESVHGLVHRDIKPANIILADHAGQQDSVKVVDFGISKALTQTSPPHADTKSEAFIVGSPRTMAPEQWQGKEVTPATDLYGLGCTVYALLAGQLPFQGKLDELSYKHIHKDPQSITEFVDIPAELVEWVGWLLRKEPVDRPRSAREALEVLQRISRHDDVTHSSATYKENQVRCSFSVAPVKLPSYRNRFVGRQKEFTILDALLEQRAQLITVQGIGGVGKTRLVVEWAKAHASKFSGGIYFCALAEAHTAEELCLNLAQTLEVPLGQGDSVQTLGHVLVDRKHALIICDSFEQLTLWAPATIGRWLDCAPEVTFLSTSHQTLGLHGERVVNLAPLSAPAWPQPASLNNEATELFVDRARMARASFDPERQLDAIAKLVHGLDGLPLAIELAAARVTALSPARMLERMSERFRLLRSCRRDTQRRQATLEAALDWSWELLESHERSTLMQCAVFQGGFSLEAAETVIDLGMFEEDFWVPDVLEALVHKSLLQAVSELDEERYTMLLSVQAYAIQKLSHAAEHQKQTVQQRHLKFFAAYGEHTFLDKLGQDKLVVDELKVELGNLKGALAYGFEHDPRDEACLCALAICAYLQIQGPYQEGIICVERTINRVSPSEALIPRLLLAAGQLERAAGQLESAHKSYEASLAQALLLNLRHCSGHALYGLGSIAREQGQPKQAQAHYEASLEHARAVNDALLEGQALYGLAFVWVDDGQPKRARETLRTCLELARATRHTLLKGSAYQALGWVEHNQGDLDRAQKSYQSSLKLARALGHKLLEGSVLMGLGHVQHAQGQFARGMATIRTCLALSRNIGHKRLEGNTLYALGLAEETQGSWSMAEESYRACLELSRGVGVKSLECYALTGLGSVHRFLNNLDQAHDNYQTSLERAREIGHHQLEGNALLGLGHVYLNQNTFQQALETLNACCALAQRIEDPKLEARAQLALSAVFREQEVPLQAQSKLHKAMQLIPADDTALQLHLLIQSAHLALREEGPAQAQAFLDQAKPLLDQPQGRIQQLQAEYNALQALVLQG